MLGRVFRGLVMAAVVGCAIAGTPGRAEAGFSLGFASDPGPQLVFNGANGFTFVDSGSPPHGFTTTTQTGGDGSGVGLQGRITGSYTIGSITSTPIPGVGTLQTASVTTSPGATLSIRDAGGFELVGDLTFAAISTLTIPGGINGGIAGSGSLNLVNITYSGTNADLIRLRDSLAATASISFTPLLGQDLAYLASTPTTTVPYSGVLMAAPAPSGLLLAGAGTFLASAGGVFFRRRRTPAKADV